GPVEPAHTPPIDATAIAPLPPEKPARVELSVTSVPAGADIYRASDGVHIGKTPFRRDFDRTDGEIEFLLKLPGYRDARCVLSTTKDGSQSIKLVKLRAPPPTPPN